MVGQRLIPTKSDLKPSKADWPAVGKSAHNCGKVTQKVGKEACNVGKLWETRRGGTKPTLVVGKFMRNPQETHRNEMKNPQTYKTHIIDSGFYRQNSGFCAPNCGLYFQKSVFPTNCRKNTHFLRIVYNLYMCLKVGRKELSIKSRT